MSDNVKNLFERSGNAKQRSVIDALRSAISDIESGAISPNKLIVLMLDDLQWCDRLRPRLKPHAERKSKPAEIVARLRGKEAEELFTRAVDILVSRLRKKLEPLQVIKTLRNAGYTFAGART